MSYHANPPPSSPNPYRLYRHPEQGRLFGVCAGLADYFGVEAGMVRLAVVVAALFLFMPVTLGYVLLALMLPRRPVGLYRSAEEEAFWRGVSQRPAVTAATVSQRYRALEQRLAALEHHVTTPEFQLSRQIRNLDR